MNDTVTVTVESEDDDVPESGYIASVVRQACLMSGRGQAQVNVQIVDETAMASLNQHYRGNNASTNVLSFDSDLPKWVDSDLIGDIVLCPAVIRREAQAYGKPLESRWAHMLVHGSLHLLGMSHEDNKRQAEMEAMEQKIMRELGYDNPYLMTA